MSKSIYTGIGDTSHKVKQLYIGIDGIARKVKKAYVGIDNIARQCWPNVVYTWKKYNISKNWSTSNSVINPNDAGDIQDRQDLSGLLITSSIDLTMYKWFAALQTEDGGKFNFNTSTGLYEAKSPWNSKPQITTIPKNVETYYKVPTYGAVILSPQNVSINIVPGGVYYNNYPYLCKKINITGINDNQRIAFTATANINWLDRATSSVSIGSYVGNVTSENPNAYPSNGISGSYWYIKQ